MDEWAEKETFREGWVQAGRWRRRFFLQGRSVSISLQELSLRNLSATPADVTAPQSIHDQPYLSVFEHWILSSESRRLRSRNKSHSPLGEWKKSTQSYVWSRPGMFLLIKKNDALSWLWIAICVNGTPFRISSSFNSFKHQMNPTKNREPKEKCLDSRKNDLLPSSHRYKLNVTSWTHLPGWLPTSHPLACLVRQYRQ